MKNKSLFGSILGFCLFALIPVVSFISCQVGLGEAVDVAAPVITIDTPKTSAIIRDTFAITGTWSDDGSIKSVEVELRNTGTDKTYSNFEPVLTMVPDTKEYKGDWYVSIDPVTAKVPDGSYEATVTITDNGKHSTEITRTFIIDNTSPVMVLSRPSSSKTDSDNLVESYGQYLTLEGQAADDNDIEKIVINFYSKDSPETLLWTKEITSVPPTISLDVAKFLDKDVYTKIYGDEKAGEKYYYCTITAYDSAKRYPLAGQEKTDDELGNAESSYILWADWEKFQSDYQKASGGNTKLKVPDLYAIKARTSASSTRSATETSLIEGLFEKAIPCGSFKLNPENSPTFSISGLELGLSTDVENERALTVQLAKGLDGLSLVTDDMKVYLIPVTSDASGKEVLGEKLYSQTSEFQKKGDGQFLTKILKDDCKNAEGTAVSLEYGKTYIIGVDGEDSEGNKIVPSFDGKQFYIKFKAKNVAPGLTITTPSPATTYLKKGQTLKFSGSTSVPDGHPTISITCKKGEETTATEIYKYQVTDADKDKIEGGLIFYNFEFTVPIDGDKFKFDQANSNQYVFDVTADLEDMPTTRTKTVIYDIDGPTISIDSMLPTAEKFTGDEDGSTEPGEYLNGDVTMKIAILDDYDAVQTMLEEGNDRRPYFIITDAQSGEEIAFRVGSETVPTVKHLITTPAKQSFVIHTEDIASGTASRKIKVKISAQDRAGNLGVDIDDTSITAFEREYTVDQSTDIPVILPYNADSLTLTYPTESAITTAISNKVYKSVLTTGSDLQLSIKDDDGVNKTTFILSEKDKAISASAADKLVTIEQTLQDRPSDYNFRYTLPTISGRYECKIEIEDTVGKKNTKDFWIVVTGAAPQVSISSTTPDNRIITLSTGSKEDGAKVQFVNEVEIESGYNEFKVTRVEKITNAGTVEENETVLYGTNNLLTAHSFTDTFVPASNRAENKIKYIITDEMGRSGEREFTYYLDSKKPIVDVDSIIVPTNTQTQSTSFKFEASTSDVSEGTVNDGYKSSGVSKIQYTFDSAKATDKIKTVRGVTSLNESIEFKNTDNIYAFSTEGKKKIYIRAIDDVGNIGDWAEKEFMYDTAEPELKVLSYKRGSEAAVNFDANAASLSFDSGNEFILSGTVNDNNGIETFEIWQKKSGSTYTTGTNTDAQLGKKLTDISVSNAASGTWSVSGLPRKESAITTTDVDSGIYTYTIRATDKSAYGSQSAKTTTQTVTVSIDKTAPTVTIDLAESNTQAYGENALKGSAYTFRGTANDTGAGSSGFDTLWYAFTTSAISNPDDYSFTLFVKPSGPTWSIPMNLGTGSTTADTSDTLYEGKKYLYVKGVDKAGNAAAVESFAFMVDQSDPGITCAVYKNSETIAATAASDGVVYLNKATSATKYTLKGTVSDANGISGVKVDNVAVPFSNGSWSKEFEVQGNHKHTIVVYDKSGNNGAAGKHTETSVSVIFDTTDPTVTVLDFNSSAIATSKYWLSGTGDTYINGTANDVGAGLQSLSIKVDDGSYAIIPISENWSYKYPIPENFAENEDSNTSYHTVTVKAVDKANNSVEVPYYFRYDKTPPTAELTLNRNGEFVRAADFSTPKVTLSGYAYDNQTTGRAVESAKITVKKDGTTIAANEIDLATLLNSTAGTNFGKFSTDLTASSYTDGLYVFTLEVKDKANNTPAAGSTLTASMTVDKTLPVIDKVTFGALSATAVSSTNAAKPTIRIQLTEKNLEGVYYYVNEGADKATTSIDDTDWLNMKYTLSSGNVYTADKVISLNDGKGKVYFKVVDKAGNVTYDTTSLSYVVDTKKPEVSLDKVDGETLTDTKLVNGDNAVTFTVKASDVNDNYDATSTTDYSKITSVKALKIKDTTVSLTGTKTDAANGIWSITIPAATIKSFTSGTYPVYVTVEDTFGNKNENVVMFSLDIDTTKPQLKSYALDTSYDAGVVSGNKTFYMNNANNGLLLTGVAYDLRGIKEVKLVLSGTNFSKTLTSTESAWTFEIGKDTVGDASGNAAWKNLTGEVTATLSVTDKAKNPTETPTASNELPPLSFKIKFDTTAPAALHKTDGSGKDIYFRVGDQDRDDGITSVNSETGAITATPAWDADLDKDVGGKYKSGTFGNQETIKIRGNFDETGSGIAMIYYKLFTTTTNIATKITEFKNDPAGKADGYFSPKAASETTRRVFYKGAISGVTAAGSIGSGDSARNYTSIASTYLTTISGFKAGHNYLVLVAVDNVGNAAVDNISGNYYTINVDTQAPVTANITDTYTNGKDENGNAKDLTLSLAVTDNPSGTGAVSAGIRSVKVKMNGVAEEKPATKNASTGKYDVTIPASELPASGTYSVSVTAIDDAGTGNSDTRVVGSVIVDKTDPSIRVTSTAGWIKNSIANASVSVNDINGIKDNKVSYNVYLSTDTSYSSSKANGTATITDGVATVASISTTNTTNFEDGKSYIVRFTAEDIVGNKAYANTAAYTVDRTKPTLTDADSGIGVGSVEVKTIANVGATNKWFNAETLKVFGTYNDEAGSVTGSGVTTINYTLTPAGTGASPITGSWQTTNGTYNSNLAGFKAGSNTLVLSAVDAMGNKSDDTTYTVKVDTDSPVISEATSGDFTKITLTNGTGNRTFNFSVADSGSGFDTTVSNIEVKVGTRTITNGSNGSTITVSGNTVTVKVGATDLAAIAAESGTYSVTAKVKDNAGNESNAERIGVLKVDSDKPVPSFTSHQNNATVNKSITLGGTITDASNSAITTITLTATCGSTTKTYKYPAGTSGADGDITFANGQWSLTIDTNVAAYNNTTTAKALSLSLTATDEADNTSNAVTLSLTIDQNSDRPVVKFTNIVREGTGANAKYILKYGNNAAIEGTITDDDATSNAVVKTFYASSSPITSATTARTGVTTFNAATGDYTFTPPSAADGAKTVYFYIVDNNDNVFYTTQTTQLTRPYKQYKTDDKEDNAAAITYNSDSNAPLINSVQLQAYTAATANMVTQEGNQVDTTKNGGLTSLGTNCIVGGTSKNYVDLKVSAKDANGVKGIVIKVKGTTHNSETDADEDIITYYRSNNSVTETDVSTYINTGTVAATENESSDHIYTTSRINITDYDDGQVTVTVKVYDNSGLYNNQESVFMIDRNAPTLSIDNNVAEGAVVYGINKITIGGSVTATDVEKIYYAVTNNTTESDEIDDSDWVEVEGQKISASIIFGGSQADAENGLPSDSLRRWIQTVYNYSDTYMTENDDNKLLSIHFKAVDACGNAGYSKRTVSVVPNGDKPVITLSYPVDKANNVHPSLAGTIRIYGNAEVVTGNVSAVYVQIDTNYNGTTFNANWKSGFDTCIEGKNTSYEIGTIGNTSMQGIRAIGTDNWNLPINSAKEFNPAAGGGTETRRMAIRIYGVGGSGKVSEPVIQEFTIDPNAPHIGGTGTDTGVMQLKLVQFGSSTPLTAGMTYAQAQAAISNQMPYVPGQTVWVKGQWYIAASVYDDSGIASIKLDENITGINPIYLVNEGSIQSNLEITTSQSVKTIFVKANDCRTAINNVTDKNNFDIYIPLPTSAGSGTLNFTLEAVEASEFNNGSTETVKVNFDNTPPKLGTAGHENYNPNAYNVQQDNGFYHLFGYATDAEGSNLVSDMKAVVFYFIRRGSANTRVYDPMWKDKPVAIQTGTTNTAGISYEYGMFWNTKTVGRVSTDLSILTLTAKDDNIHAGGFVLMGGTIYTIRSVSADGKTITLKTDAPAGITEAKFAYAMVIDNFNMTESTDTRNKITNASAYGYGYYAADSTADDGDLMQEKWANGKWDAWINSANIPDGPIELHYVALDNAQNYSVGVVGNLSLSEYQAKTTLDVSANGTPGTAANNLISGFDYIYNANKKAYVSNNAPRIAGVTVGTDYNGNGTVETTEKQTKYVGLGTRVFSGIPNTSAITEVLQQFNASSDGTASGLPFMRVVDSTDVEIEIIGGNNEMYYRYHITENCDDTATFTNGTYGTGNSSWQISRTAGEGYKTDDDGHQGYYTTTRLPAINFTNAQLKSAIGGDNGTNGTRWWTIQVWDSTEETTHFVNSQYAELKLPLNVEVLDGTRPNTVISPLYWKSATDNSVYKNVNDELFGHVELIKDIGSSQLGTTYGTTDDKVSGVVVFRGFAYDNKRLAQLDWAIVDSTEKSILPNANSGITYNTGSTFSSTGWSSGGTLAYDSTEKKVTGTYKFTVKTAAEDGAYLDAKGHKVAWELAVDTSAISGIVAKDAKLYVRAKDNSGSTTTQYTDMTATGSPADGVTDQEAIDKVTKKPTYQVDILPYITKITTRMAKKDTTNPEVYSRTAKGHYPIASDETTAGSVVLHGYNLAASNADVDISSGMGSRETGAYAYPVSGTITTINNMNNNDAHGDYDLTTEGLAEKTKVANMYNRQPNTSTNLNLTDDVYFDMWELNNGAATSGSALRYPVMHINPTNNQIGFGFVRGSDSVSFPANGNSYLWYQKNRKDYIGTNFVYDSNGIAHNVSIGLDAQFDTGIAGRMLYNNSNWYAGNNGANRIKQWDKRYSIALESIGIPNGVYVKGVNTNVSGGQGIIDIDRFATPAIASSAHSGGTAVYIIYYDSDHDQIRFRYGEVPLTGDNRTNTQYGLLSDDKSEHQRHGTATQSTTNNTQIASDTSNDNDTWNAHGMFEASKSYYALVTGKYYNQTNDGLNGTAGTLRNDTGNNGSAYYALGVIPGNSMNNDKVVMVWFDQVADKLMYMYRMNLGTNDNASNRDASSTGVTNVWSTPEAIYSGPLQDCAMTVDINDGIHIVAYDQNNANLLYMYKQSYNTTGVYSCVVDSYSQIGNRLSIDTALNADNKVVPYISYFAEGLSSLPKLAYLPNGITTTSATTIAASIKDGADASTNLFTGDWEVTMIPTSSKLQTGAGYNVSIGVFKDKTAGSVGQAFKPEKGTDSMSNDKNTCSRYANGTTELVLGYGIKNNGVGYIETAMRK